ncbi:uracil DNA glycosylase a isoform X5 [Phyllopteryx taeniolatus]|uniref:uracil DNA glycosylase a isoform X5 n=1 Tax=Phyllopteryx taeniolatus TaxID=161469 RepID=UPI002AD4EDDE|nr:uracil DNA glycosylase a isoform X5 [Phyllopteryx taeniolatus]
MLLAVRRGQLWAVLSFAVHPSPALRFAQFSPTMQRKRKSSEVEAEPSGSRSAPLSQEQLDLIARNKKAALERLSSGRTPTGFGESWQKALAAEFGKPYFKQLMQFVNKERKHHTVYPPADHVFTWTQMCEVRHVKVVILGQDPYHGPNQAHGLCFSVKSPVPPPPSLENMYKELATDIEGFQHPRHGDLSGWAKQGVLLLNAVLTVRAHQANSHKDKGWETFTDAVVQWLSDNLEGLVFVLWGAYAQKKGATINRANGLDDFIKKIRGSYWTALKINWKVWTPFQFVNVNFVPVESGMMHREKTRKHKAMVFLLPKRSIAHKVTNSPVEHEPITSISLCNIGLCSHQIFTLQAASEVHLITFGQPWPNG